MVCEIVEYSMYFTRRRKKLRLSDEDGQRVKAPWLETNTSPLSPKFPKTWESVMHAEKMACTAACKLPCSSGGPGLFEQPTMASVVCTQAPRLKRAQHEVG